MESFMICISPYYFEFSFLKANEMEMGIWDVWSEKRGKQDFGGDTVGKEATRNILA
jgi:hypothetical protein